MPKSLRFWSNVALIAIAHVIIIVGLIHWSRESKDANAQNVVWMNGGGGDGIVSESKNPPALKKQSRTEAARDRESEEDRPVLASAPSEIQLPTPAANPRSTSTPKPSATSEKKVTPKPTARPRPTPKPTPKPSPKKLVIAKASPKPSAKPTPEKEENEPAEGSAEIAKAVPIKEEPKKSSATQTGSGKAITAGTGNGRAGGSANAGQFSWYGSMLHDRFYSEWVQPTAVADAGSMNSVLVKLRIENDGRVSSFEVVRPSGNAELDESVKALANRVSHVEPLPEGLGKGDHYDVKINFELNSE
jgi:colicin import membrane protein